MRVWYNHGYSQTHDALRLIRKADPAHVLIASHGRAETPVFLQADEHAVEPSLPRGEGVSAYVDWCLDFAAAHKVDLFVAQRDRAAIVERAAEFAAVGTTVVAAADAAMLGIIDDKAQFYARCAAAGLPTPAFHLATSVDAFDTAVAALRAQGHAVCIKPPHGVFASGYFRLEDDVPLYRQLHTIDGRALPTAIIRAALEGMGADMPPTLVMQHLPGTEWSVDCLCNDGRIVAGVSRRKAGFVQRIEAGGPALDLAAEVAALFGLSNLVNIQLKAADPGDGRPHVLEINPRMSGGCLYADLAGLNLPYLQLLQASGRLRAADIPQPRAITVAAVQAAVELAAGGTGDA